MKIRRHPKVGPRSGFIETLILFGFITALKEILFKPDIENAKPNGLGDFEFPTATQGRAVPLIWGTPKLTAPNVIWYGDLETLPITREVKTGLFSSEDQIVGYQ